VSFIIGSCEKWFPGFIRREYTRNLQDGYGDYYACFIHGLRVIQGRSLKFQCVLSDEAVAGAGFLAPIEAFCWKIPDEPRAKGVPVDMTYVQPWDSFSSTFGVHEFDFHRRMKALILPSRVPARYRFSIDFAGSALSEYGEQHKHLHIMELEDGQIGAFPNNRVVWCDPAFWEPLTERPDFIALGGEYMAE
jgi:hypothetical protein